MRLLKRFALRRTECMLASGRLATQSGAWHYFLMPASLACCRADFFWFASGDLSPMVPVDCWFSLMPDW
ncbi:MAG: hypothetical protein Q8Q59_05420 [Luteolibacter sp.]|jgi:hypothetical protein|nr:hypothetical protein [Luteolibacter sp.]